jgi:hypothetical protein
VALEFDFAIRLLEKFLGESNSKGQFRADLCSHVSQPETGGTLLHDLANLSLTTGHTDSVQKFLDLLAPDLSALKAFDKRGTSPVHYAAHMHNFVFIDFLCKQISNQAMLDLFTFKDSLGHSAYALLFWQIGRIEYSDQVKDKIKAYTLTYAKKSDHFETISNAYFPLTNSFLESPKISKLFGCCGY